MKELLPTQVRSALGSARRRANRLFRQVSSHRRTLLHPFAPVVVAEAYGRQFRFPARNITFETEYARTHRRTWKSVFFEAMASDPRRAFLDVGANVGQTLLEFRASKAPQTYCGFEPNPVAAAFCLELIRANSLDACVFTCALGADYGVMDLLMNPDHAVDAGGSLVTDLRPGRNYRREPALVLPLGMFRGRVDFRDVALMKIDVEGAEALVLEGCTDLFREGDPVVLCEVLRADPAADPAVAAASAARILAVLDAHGYAAYSIVKASENVSSVGLRRISAFPTDVHRRESLHMSDYVFLRPHHLDLLARSAYIAVLPRDPSHPAA